VKTPVTIAPEALDFTRLIRSGETVGWAEATAEPVFLTRLLDAQVDRCPPFRVFFALTFSDAFGADHPNVTALGGASAGRRFFADRADNVIPANISDISGPRIQWPAADRRRAGRWQTQFAAPVQVSPARSPSAMEANRIRIAVCLKSVHWPMCHGPICSVSASAFSLVASRPTPKIPPTMGNVISHPSKFVIWLVLYTVRHGSRTSHA
jgi:hypothetical protein